MSEKLPLVKNVYDKIQFIKTIDTQFTPTQSPVIINQLISTSVDQFFSEYETLFYAIPKLGITNSHEYLIKTSQKYIGNVVEDSDLSDLIAEINSLRLTIFEQQETISNLITGSING